MDTTQTVTHIGLCAGYGGIELGLKRAIPNLRSIALCEVEAFAIANLVAKMESGQLDPAPIWPNLKTFPWESFCGCVDILTGGYPCQPFSAAGKRLGGEDPRHLWPYIADGIRLLRPRCCFFENVEGHISLGLSDVIEDLAGMGYRTTWGIFSASEVGAPHQRKRVFIMAVASGFRGAAGLSGPLPRHEGQSGESDDGGHQVMADASSQGLQGCRRERGYGEGGSEIQTGGSRCSAWPSRPGEQQYGWEPPRIYQTQPPLGGDVDGSAGGMDYAELCVAGDNRTDELRLLGNGVVPATAELAYRTLMRELLQIPS
jgi:DNA (cytosine-5)-methyltransferase 1